MFAGARRAAGQISGPRALTLEDGVEDDVMPEDKLRPEAYKQVVEIEANGAADFHELAVVFASHRSALCFVRPISWLVGLPDARTACCDEDLNLRRLPSLRTTRARSRSILLATKTIGRGRSNLLTRSCLISSLAYSKDSLVGRLVGRGIVNCLRSRAVV